MCRLYLFVLGITVVSIIRHVQGSIDYRDPPFSAEVFVDLPKLQLMSVQHRDVIQTPLRCSHENGSSTCDKQLCCEGEIGCCFRDPDSHRQACGCKPFRDSECTLPAPLAVLRSYVCEPEEMGQLTMCLRKVREGELTEASISSSSGMIQRPNSFEFDTYKFGSPTLNNIAFLASDLEHSLTGKKREGLLEQDAVDQLENDLDLELLDKLVDRVIEKRANGISYGRRTTAQK